MLPECPPNNAKLLYSSKRVNELMSVPLISGKNIQSSITEDRGRIFLVYNQESMTVLMQESEDQGFGLRHTSK